MFEFMRSSSNAHVSLRFAAWLLLAAAVALGAACTTLPPATSLERPVTHALADPDATPLGKALTPLEAAHPGQSGFRLLTDGTDALQMRIAVARAATQTLDLQYYIASEDTTGRLLLAAALYAADRGVRVRMLVDDLNFKDSKRLMAALATHARIEVRVFNPFGSAHDSVFARTEDLFTRIDRFTRRMHNKAMIADGAVAIVGGRNLGDEYFSASPKLQFRDLDVLAAGPIVAKASASFDQFWNSALAYPVAALDKGSYATEDLRSARDALRTHWRTEAQAVGARPLTTAPLAARIAQHGLGLVWAPAQFLVDSPRKVTDLDGTYRSPPMQRLAQLLGDARHEVLILSPYFVPHDAGVRLLGTLTHRGVRVIVVTNSMASTDAVAVQAGYNPYRIPLLENGVELYEFQPLQRERSRFFAGSNSRSSLHAKAYVIDRRKLVIGSMNFDPRSAHLNTELALFIDSEQLANQVASLIVRATSPDVSYRVTLATPEENARLRALGAPVSGLEWSGDEHNGSVSYRRTWSLDPEAGFVRNLLTGFFRLLPIDSQL
ncbi:phospholipase D family protein [Trinickia caryophylli]|uniref:Putative cardiolipin synthase n=2 Tax=Trinickia caryophylli TaxID=28094 RepID=A0A1X7DUD5_TRICW|nr:phospholipase D family protein [Trinickia caryophylli]SMF21576.1 putative cardiolipin synthase [Trinickia caryophylli]